MSIILELGALAVMIAVVVFAGRRLGYVVSVARAAAVVLGTYAGILGAVHGYHELQQGGIAPDGLLINAIGDPCVPETVWHACLPALTIIPNMQVAGLLTIGVGMLLFVWAVAFVGSRRGVTVMNVLAVTLLLVGGGFFPPFYGAIAGLFASRIPRSTPTNVKKVNEFL